MSFFERIFNWGAPPKVEQPNIPFGRYTDTYKTKAQYDAWDKSMAHFDKEEVMAAWREFLVYLRDEKLDNVQWAEENETIKFEFTQGSRRIRGFANAEKFKASGLIARASSPNVGFLRRLMEYNFSLKYSRFALSPENEIAILFDSGVPDGSPYKLYHGLKELAVNADKQDDLLLDEFKMLEPLDTIPGGEISLEEKEVKHSYLVHEINKAFEVFDKGKPDPNQYPGGYAYLFLYLTYKLDYLVRPEGFMMEALEKIHRAYFASSPEEKSTQLKNIAMRKDFQKLLERPKEDFFKEMYRTKSTFGITTPVNHDRLAALIEGELPNMDWYAENKHVQLALSVPGYIATYSLFNYAMPKPDRDLMHLFVQIMEAGFFRDLGFQLPFYDSDGKPDKKAILREIKNITEENRAVFIKLDPDLSKLDFSSPTNFAKSFMEMVKGLDLAKAD